MSSGSIYETITEIAKRRGFYWPSFEIYGSVGGFFTYGDVGVKLKRNIEGLWRDFFVRRQGFLEIDDPIINPAKVFEASGHLKNFREYSTECSTCGRSFRADHLIEEKAGLENVEAMGGDTIKKLLAEHKVRCPVCGGDLKEPVLVLTMFQTQIGAKGGEVGYARPEAAQGMFTNFRRGYLLGRERLPFALAQTGKVQRNEISPRKGMHRLREYTIMELELFFDPQNPSCPWLGDIAGEKLRLITEEMGEKGIKEPVEVVVKEAVEKGYLLTEWQAYFMGLSKKFVSALGVPEDRQRFRAHLPEERSHYSSQTYDHEIRLDGWGWTEVSGHAYRTDYDLKAHQAGSGQDMSVLRQDGSRFIPHVVEPSFGLDRLFYVTMETAYERREKRNIFRFPRRLAPYSVGVFALVTKDGLPEKAAEMGNKLVNEGFMVASDDSGSIGRRYARQDEIGTPLNITIDYDTIEKGLVTIRDRDSWRQVSVYVNDLREKLRAYFDGAEFTSLGPLVQKPEG